MSEYGMINSRDSQRSWLQGVVDGVLGRQRQQQVASNYESLYAHAAFVCTTCAKPYTATVAIDQLEGICAKCGPGPNGRGRLAAIADLQKAAGQQFEEHYDCAGCDSVYSESEIQNNIKCACGNDTRFVPHSILNRVMANTNEFMRNRGAQISDLYHSQGIIYAGIQGRHQSGKEWKASVRCGGNFTENDLLMFEWSPERGAEGFVATAQVGSNLLPFLPNLEAAVECVMEDDQFDPKSVTLHTASANTVQIGTRLAWYKPRGVIIKGEVTEAYADGSINVGITYDENGKTKPGSFAGYVRLTQEDIQKLGVEVE